MLFLQALVLLPLLWPGSRAQEYGAGVVPTRVKIDSGLIIGAPTTVPGANTAVNRYLGVPFAKSPPARFEPPEQVAAWSQPLETKQFKPSCIQALATGTILEEFYNRPPPPESEDCLYLNVFAPTNRPPRGGRAVLFWIHGGGFVWGTASSPLYDGSAFAAFEDVVVVTINYRTNVFGFPGSPELAAERRNLGLLDQRAALDWVQRNIGAFGGDPRKVTIFGQSAGAASADLHITSFPSDAPFRAAILQSGQFTYQPPVPSVSPSWAVLAAALNCGSSGKPDNLTCLRDVPAETIKETLLARRLRFTPVVDSFTFFPNMRERRAAKNIAQVPVLIGTNSDEGDISIDTATNLTLFLNQFFGFLPAVRQQVEETYKVGQDGLETEAAVISRITTDATWACLASEWAKATAAVGIPAWRYLLAASFRNLAPRGLDLGAFHGIEIPLIFSTYPREGATRQQVELSNLMRRTWANFAKDPRRGPGWNPVPNEPYLGVFGQGDSTRVTPTSTEEVDRNCKIFGPLFGF